MMSSNLSSGRTCSSRYIGSGSRARSEEHTSELQSQSNLVCRLLLEKKKKNKHYTLVPSNNDLAYVPYKDSIACSNPCGTAFCNSQPRAAMTIPSSASLLKPMLPSVQ